MNSSINSRILLIDITIIHLVKINTSSTAKSGFSYPTSTEHVSKTIVWLLCASKGEEIVNLLLASLNIYNNLFNI